MLLWKTKNCFSYIWKYISYVYSILQNKWYFLPLQIIIVVKGYRKKRLQKQLHFLLFSSKKIRKKIMVEIKYKFSIDFVFNLFSLLKYCSTIQLVFSFVHFVVCIEKDYRYHMEISCYAMQIIALEAYYVSR